MQRTKKSWLFALTPIVLALAACGGGSDSSSPSTPSNPSNPDEPVKPVVVQSGLYKGNSEITYTQHLVFNEKNLTQEDTASGNNLIFIDATGRFWVEDEFKIEEKYQFFDISLAYSAAHKTKDNLLEFSEILPSIQKDDYYLLTGNINNDIIQLTSSFTLKEITNENNNTKETHKLSATSTSEIVSKNNYDYTSPATISNITGKWTAIDYYENMLNETSGYNKINELEINQEGEFSTSACGAPLLSATPDESGYNYFEIKTLDKITPCPTSTFNHTAYNADFSGIIYSYLENEKEILVVNLVSNTPDEDEVNSSETKPGDEIKTSKDFDVIKFVRAEEEEEDR